MLISTKGRYALRVMAELAQCPGDTPVPLRDIAERQGISEKYLEAILKKLCKLVWSAVHGQRRRIYFIL